MTYQIYKEQADSGQPIYIYENNEIKVPLNSRYSPEKEAQRFLKKICNIKRHFVILIGFGNGSLLNCLVESNVLEQNVHYFFIEPFSEIELSSKHCSLIKEHNKLSFVKFADFSAMTVAKYLSKFSSVPVSIHVHPNYLKANQSMIKDCLKVIQEGIETKQIFNNTEMQFALDWIIEPLKNTEHIPNSINLKKLKGKFQGERAILIAAGPSLQDDIDFLKKNQNSFHLFSVGSALRALLTNGINPDYTLSIDASDRNFETHFKGLNYNGTLVYETMSNSKIQDGHSGSLIVSKSSADHVTSQFFNDLFTFSQSSPSVAVYALQVIVYLGFSEIYLVGQDLALVNGNYYSEGIKHHEGMTDLKNELWVKNNEGDLVGTTRSLKIFLDTFEALIKTLPESITIYNLSRYGAKIEGTTYISSNMIEPSHKKTNMFDKNTVHPSSSLTVTDFLEKLDLLRKEVNEASRKLNRYISVGLVSSVDMKKVVKGFHKVTKHKILEEVILSRLTFMFDNIINKFVYFDEKAKYISDDLLLLVNELNHFYELIEKYINSLLVDERITKYK
ncbi:hypothetical protein J2Z40_002558 [Cytobacillus eiseniae]|uniref:6-hydroxymethylpterin diphosphokinase MptE-like domain-containing protein n=1 Tax=Cytobacillus eiseniae TaxID=762947 RepID=A0ABS4RGF1_9BACI|nr:6-hydroxymethylpterin diphosphokinase MptE-like protein [Cytobacillus eiseniae]MBP2241985.1 hypothetical protein [Cytobacillus eiseniae]